MRRQCRMLRHIFQHFGTGYGVIMQKPSETDRPRAVAGQRPHARGAHRHERRQKIAPPFFRRASPNDPKSIMPSILMPPMRITLSQVNHTGRKIARKRCVHALGR